MRCLRGGRRDYGANAFAGPPPAPPPTPRTLPDTGADQAHGTPRCRLHSARRRSSASWRQSPGRFAGAPCPESARRFSDIRLFESPPESDKLDPAADDRRRTHFTSKSRRQARLPAPSQPQTPTECLIGCSGQGFARHPIKQNRPKRPHPKRKTAQEKIFGLPSNQILRTAPRTQSNNTHEKPVDCLRRFGLRP